MANAVRAGIHRNTLNAMLRAGIIERLSREMMGTRFGRTSAVPGTYPREAFNGHMACLISETSASDGDIFPHYFREAGLGPLIGKRTWGGVVGIWPRAALVDGSITTQPEFAFWFEDVGYGIENYGTDPDIEVEIRPQDYAAGRDPQLESGLVEIGRALRKSPPKMPEFGTRPKNAPRGLPKQRK